MLQGLMHMLRSRLRPADQSGFFSFFFFFWPCCQEYGSIRKQPWCNTCSIFAFAKINVVKPPSCVRIENCKTLKTQFCKSVTVQWWLCWGGRERFNTFTSLISWPPGGVHQRHVLYCWPVSATAVVLLGCWYNVVKRGFYIKKKIE